MSTRAFTGILAPEPSRDLERVRHALRTYGPEAERRFTSAAGEQLTRAWTEELNSRTGFSEQQRGIVKAEPLVTVGRWGLVVGTGGAGPLAFLTRALEFGALSRELFSTYSRKNRKGSGFHQVSRRTKRQIPPRSQTGWIAYPAAGVLSTRVFRMAFHILVKVAHDAVDGGRRG